MMALVVMLVVAILGMLWPRRWPVSVFIGAAVLGLFGAVFALYLPNPLAQFPMLSFSRFTEIFSGLFIALSAIVLLMLPRGARLLPGSVPEYAALVLFSAMGGLVLLSCTHLITFFIGIEMLSIPLYILAASNTQSSASHEAGLKYFILGSVASAVMLFGMALLFAQTGQLYLAELLNMLRSGVLDPISAVGIALLLFGLFFKVGLVPFHFWVPDVYQGTPLVFSGFMATLVKGAGFVILFRIFSTGGFHGVLGMAIWGMAALTMIVGNWIALKQTSFKRILAYSSVAHSGYIAMLLLVPTSAAAFILFFYILAYSLAILTLFYIYDVQTSVTTDSLMPLHGLAHRSPILAFGFILSVLSLAGIPPFAGFFSKYVLFVPVMGSGLVGLLLVAVLSSVMGAVYYLRLIPLLFVTTGEKTPTVSVYARVLVGFLSVSILLIGVLPSLVSRLFH